METFKGGKGNTQGDSRAEYLWLSLNKVCVCVFSGECLQQGFQDLVI